jgi:WhiB family redox-sensing transcriptional regulator
MEAKAKAVCANCPVSRPCLEMALADPHIEGVWGGTSDKDRRRIRKGLAA